MYKNSANQHLLFSFHKFTWLIQSQALFLFNEKSFDTFWRWIALPPYVWLANCRHFSSTGTKCWELIKAQVSEILATFCGIFAFATCYRGLLSSVAWPKALNLQERFVVDKEHYIENVFNIYVKINFTTDKNYWRNEYS